MRSHRFIERSMGGFLAALEHALDAEEYARRDGLLQSLDPRVKLAGILALIVSVAVSQRIAVILALFGVALVLAVSSRVPLRTLAVKVWIGVFLFTGLIALPALTLTPGTRCLPAAAAGLAGDGARAARRRLPGHTGRNHGHASRCCWCSRHPGRTC